MNEIDIKILEHCAEEYVPLSHLAKEGKKSTIYRHAKGLTERGLLDKNAKGHKTTDKGIRTLGETKHTKELDLDDTTLIHPSLKLVPTINHKAIIELVLAAIVSRKNELRAEHHPTFILFGTTLKWKTWTARFISAILGLDPARTVLLLTSESGRSILTRKGYGGATVSKRGILQLPFVCFDEYQKSPPSIKTLCNIYIQGRKTVPYENELLDIEPVTLITLNAKEGDCLTERTGFEEPQIRRSIVCDMDEVVIPSTIKTKGEDILEAVGKYPALLIPEHKLDCFELREKVYKLLADTICKDKLRLLDIEMIMLICSGMMAFMPKNKAVIRVLYNYHIIFETVGWVKKGWQKQLNDFAKKLHINTNDSSLKEMEMGVLTRGLTEGTLHDQVRHLIESRESPIDYDLKISRTIDKLESLNITAEDLDTILTQHKNLKKLGFDFETASLLGNELKKTGLGKKNAVQRIVSLVNEHGSLMKAIANQAAIERTMTKTIEEKDQHLAEHDLTIKGLGLTNDRIKELSKLDGELKGIGINPDKVASFITFHRELYKLGFDPKSAIILAEELDNTGLERRDAVRKLVDYIHEFGNLETAHSTKKNEVDSLKSSYNLFEGKVQTKKKELEEIKEKELNLVQQVQMLKDKKVKCENNIRKGEENYRNVLERLSELLKVEANVDTILEESRTLQICNSKLMENSSLLEDETKSLLKIHQRMRTDIEFTNGLFGYLSTPNIPYNDEMWQALESLLKIHQGQAPYLKLDEPFFKERLRIRLIEIYKKVINPDIVSKWEHQQVKTKNDELRLELKKEKEMNQDLNREKNQIEDEMKSFRTFFEEPAKLSKQHKEVIFEFYNDIIASGVEKTLDSFRWKWYNNYLYCGVCGKVFTFKFPTTDTISKAIGTRTQITHECPHCLHRNDYDPSAVLAKIDYPIFPLMTGKSKTVT